MSDSATAQPPPPTLSRRHTVASGMVAKGGVANIKVAVRTRPLNEDEKKAGTNLALQSVPEQQIVKMVAIPNQKRPERKFHFDEVFGMYSKQEEVYQAVTEPIALEALHGYNCTVFAYGPTGTGKTYTMEGDIEDEELWGMIPRSSATLLTALGERATDFTVKASYLELYNEELRDLLTVATERRPLKLIEDLKRGVICQNLEEFNVATMEDVLALLRRGIQARSTASTLKNQNSSRSHAIFSLRVIMKESNGEEEVVTTGQLNLVDLAGAESIGRSGAKNDRAREAGSINQSLLTLGRVITTLVDRAGHVPYRDSKLTRLLQESLGGKAKTCIIATLSPSMTAVEESQSTLEYAHRARSVKNQPMVNSQISQKVVMKEKFIEIEALRLQLMQTREKNGVYVDPAEFYAMENKLSTQAAQLAECEGALKQREEELRALKADKQQLIVELEDVRKDLEAADQLVEEVTNKFEQAQQEVKQAFVELKASEAVVGEQASTEAKLLAQGGALQKDLTACQGDVGQLLQKVELLSKSEAQKVQDTQDFVQQLSSNASALAAQVQLMAQQSQEQAQSLGKGVTKMLQQGRETCGTLRASIEKASGLMITNAERSREDMMSSCKELKGHFSDTNSQLESSLRTMKETLLMWLKDVDDNIEKAQDQLVSLNNEMELATSTVSHHCTGVREAAEAFNNKQDALYKDSARQLEDLRSELDLRLSSFQKENQTAVAKATAAINTKAEAMESALKAMLKDLVRAGSSALDSCGKGATEAVRDSQRMLQEGAEEVRATQQAIQKSAAEYTDDLEDRLDNTRKTYHSHAHEVQFHRETARTTVEAVQAAVAAEKKGVDDNVSRILEEIESALLKGSMAVDDTSQVANKIVDDVGASSSKMNETVSESMTTFGRYMDKEGEELSSALGKHFGVVGTHLEAQAGGLSALREGGEQHGQSIADSTLQPRSTTPRKLRKESSSSLQPLKRSRGVEEVAQQAREDVAAATAAGEGGVTYETASEQLHKHHFNPATLPAAVSAAVAAASIYIDEGELSGIESYSEVMVEEAPIELSETPCEVACNSADSGEAMAAGQAENTEGAGNFDDYDEVEAGDEDGENAHPNSTPVPAAAFCEPLVSKSAPGIDNGSSRLPRTSASSKGTKGAKGTKGKSTTGLRKTRSSAASVAMAESV